MTQTLRIDKPSLLPEASNAREDEGTAGAESARASGCASTTSPRVLLWIVSVLCIFLIPTAPAAVAQTPADSSAQHLAQPTPDGSELSPVAARVDIEPVARDEQIRERLERILVATGWFTNPTIRVEEGVVFLRGRG